MKCTFVFMALLAASPVAAQDWSGPYAGLSLESDVGSTWDFTFDGAPVSNGAFQRGTLGGVFGGYNIQRGNLVYGGELAFSPGELHITNVTVLTRFTDVKAHVGYAFGRAMAYGTLGYAVAQYGDGLNFAEPKGVSYGLGLSYQINERFFAGGEYLLRDLSGEFPDSPGLVTHNRVETFSLRVGMTF